MALVVEPQAAVSSITNPTTTAAVAAPPAGTGSNLTELPEDILHLLLQSLQSFTTLRSLLLTAPIFPALLSENPTTIYTRIASRHFPAVSFTLLDLWRPQGLTPFQRRYITERTNGLISGDEFGLAEDPKVVGVREVERMVSDKCMIEKLVDWVVGIMSEGEQIGVEKCISAEAETSNVVEIPIFNLNGKIVSEHERARVRNSIYGLISLISSVHSKALAASDYVHEVLPTTLFDSSLALFDYNPVLNTTTLLTHLQMLAVADILAPALPFFADMQVWLKSLLWDRAIDITRLYNDEQWEMVSLVEYVRAGALADKWQEELAEFCRVAGPEVKGFRGGLDWTQYERREITTQDWTGKVCRKNVLVNLELDG